MDENSGDFSDELDEFEESIDETKQRGAFAANNRNQTTYSDKPYDEAYEISQDLSMAESYDGRDKNQYEKERKLKNDKYDEAVEVSQSLDQKALANMTKAKLQSEEKEVSKGMKKGTEQTKSQSVMNKHFDEALEFSHSGSDDSVDTKSADKPKKGKEKLVESKQGNQITTSVQKSAGAQNSLAHLDTSSTNKKNTTSTTATSAAALKSSQQAAASAKKKDAGEESSSDEEGEHEESYDNIEGAYNPKDYLQLNVTAEVRDLFQYIERYKAQEVELETPLKCFIPEFIPAIGELDAFIKIPRPDGKEDGLGLRYLDEPSSNQSDPTVLELQLRAKSKKLQNGDVVVRSIEGADRNPAKIEKWIQDIADLHRSKPPPQVHYKKNMPDIDTLMDVWPEEMEALLDGLSLPPPELDISLSEYVRVLCAILDIPVYDNPIESLHVMLTLYLDFKNNPHFQARMAKHGGGEFDAEEKGSDGRQQQGGRGNSSNNNNNNNNNNNSNYFGGADVMQIDQD